MTRAAAIVLVLALAAHAAPKLKPRPPETPDVVVGAEFFAPWPPTHIPPPHRHCRIAAVSPDGVDIRIVGDEGRRLYVGEDGGTWTTDVSEVWVATSRPLPTAAQVQRLIEQSRE